MIIFADANITSREAMIEDMKTDSKNYEADMRFARPQDNDSSLRYPTPPTEGSGDSDNGEEGDADMAMSEDDTENADTAT
jgi:hypothetical protein